jgi:para-aminobenzoate synthetase component 1
MHIAAHDWCHPLECFHALAADYPNLVFLYSGLHTSYSGALSWLAFDSVEQFDGDDVALLRHAVASSHEIYPSWFGYLAYEFGRDIPSSIKPTTITMPKLRLSRFRHILKFDHITQTLTRYSIDNAPFDLTPYIVPTTQDAPLYDNLEDEPLLPVEAISSNMSKTYYRQHIENTLEAIRAGNFYQANITRKFMGRWRTKPTQEQLTNLFHHLSYVSPAPYSAYLAYDDATILSSSPELFLKLAPDGTLSTRPIKGTVSLENHADLLENSEKNRAENLMIVDLMRNDFSKVAQLGTVNVPQLFDIDNFKTLRHLSSTITAKLEPTLSTADAIMACFPAGSMTGAPKKRVIAWCEHIEAIERGVYSGAIGWISRHSCELSVVIRTLITRDKQFEFQVGGGIVADSDAHDEWQETMTKARGLAHALGIDIEDLSSL